MNRMHTVRMGMIMLAINAQFAPVAFAQRKDDNAYNCSPSKSVIELGNLQADFFESLDWKNYKICEDLALFTNEEVLRSDNEHYIFANRDDNDSFVFTVDTFVPILEWSKYKLDRHLVNVLNSLNARAGIILGTANETIPFTAITFSIDAIAHHPDYPLRYNGIILIDYDNTAKTDQYDTGCNELKGHEGEYQRCKDIARSKFEGCNSKAKNSFYNNIANQAGLGAGIGGLLGCIAGKMATAGPLTMVAWKVIVAWCAVGAIVGILLSLWQAWNTYQTELQNCLIGFWRDLEQCQILHCETYSVIVAP